MLSKNALEILATGKGYRDDTVSTVWDGVKPIEMLNEEINESGNTDVFNFIKEHYGGNVETLQDIDDYIKSVLETDTYHLIWLCSKPDDVKKYYGVSITGVRLPEDAKNYMIISDLASSGVWIAYTGTVTYLY